MRFKLKQELKRKSLHVPALIIPWIYPQFPLATLTLLGIASGIYLYSEILRIRGQCLPLLGPSIQNLVRNETIDWAPLYLSLGITLTCLLFSPKALWAGIFLVAVSDAAAALVGISWGKRRILYTHKTYEGSLSFFLVSWIYFASLGSFSKAFLFAAITSLLELFSPRGWDNFFLPIAGAALVQYWL